MKFSEYLRLDEGLGNLKGLPKEFIDVIVGRKGYIDFNGQGGENSKIELYKKNAKPADLTAIAKKIRGYVPPKDRSNRGYSDKELEAKEAKKSYAAVAIKINGEWAYLASFDEYGDGTAKFMLISNEGVVTKQEREYIRKKRDHRKKTIYTRTRTYLKASEIKDIIDFSQDVDIYLITVDPQRVLNKEKRELERKEANKPSPERRKALAKFLQKKTSKIIKITKEESQKDIDMINKYVEETISRATEGKPKREALDLESIVNDLRKSLQKAEALGYYIENIIKDGGIKDYRGDDSWEYKKLKEFLKEFEELEKED